MSPSRSRAAAFTLIELLVVIAIIAVLIGLIVPVLQMVRASAMNAQCASNLKQIGIALHSYHTRTNSFPPAYVDSNPDPLSDASFDRGPGWGWAALLLHDLDHDGVYGQIDFTKNAGTNPVCQTFLPIFWCPADNQLPTFTVYGSSPTATPLAVVAQGNYIAVNGTKETSAYPGCNTGSFLRNRKFRTLDIADGLSNTLFIGERHSGHSRTTWVGAVPGGSLPALLSTDPNAPAELAAGLVLGHGNRLRLPNDPQLTDADVFYSRHPGGVNFLFGDGSVRAIGGGIDGIVYENLLNRADGNAMGEF